MRTTKTIDRKIDRLDYRIVMALRAYDEIMASPGIEDDDGLLDEIRIGLEEARYALTKWTERRSD